GEIIEVMPGRTSNSQIHDIIVAEVRPFCKTRGIICYTSSADGAFNVHGNVIAPDFAYKRTPMSNDYPDPVAPLWVVEIISPTDQVGDIRRKRAIYLAAHILLWEIYPEDRTVDVFAPDQPIRTYSIGDSLDVSDLIPGFTLLVRELFTGE
ncbi:MAG: Uma2 family endonuclease, partial [Chloroflexota bacterium]